MDTRDLSAIKRLMIMSLAISMLTVTVLIYITSFQKIKIKKIPRSEVKPEYIMKFGLQKADGQSTKLGRFNNSVNITNSQNYGPLQEPYMPNNGVMSCHITVVVRGYFLHFLDLQPKNRITWCPNHACYVSLIYSSNLTDILNANVTFFSHLTKLPRARDLHYLVENRRPDQRYVLMSYETPLRVARNTTLPSTLARSFHHWLATYDPSSDIPFTYGRFSRLPLDHSIPNYFNLKSKLVAFVSSNCIHSKWRRLDFVLELQKYIPIDIYGRCGNLTCDINNDCTKILQQYKFILALENSPCPGYITEKFWNAIWKFESVAIAWGANGIDYETFTPPESFIYVEDFQSIESLAGFITDLGENETRYNNYHEWRTKYRVELQDDLVNVPSDEHLCLTADRYMADNNKPNRTRSKIRTKNTTGKTGSNLAVFRYILKWYIFRFRSVDKIHALVELLQDMTS